MRRRKRSHPSKTGLPKGAYRLPEGGIVMPPSKPQVVGVGRGERRISVQAVRRDVPDLHGLARVLVDLAKVEAEKARSESTGSSRSDDEQSRAA